MWYFCFMNGILEGEALVRKAAELAERWHDGQEHFFGDDSYFNMHLRPVADIARRLGYGALFVAGALLHDIGEDTAISNLELEQEGIPPAVIHAVRLLAKQDGQSHEEYLNGILTSPIAVVAKFADSSFNYSWTMLNSPHIGDEDFKNWGLEYAHNIAVLCPALPTPGQATTQAG